MGDPCISNIFNPKAFINVGEFATIDDAIEEIKKIDSDDERYYEMLNEPALQGNTLTQEGKHKELELFFLNIFDQDLNKAIRRNRVCWGRIYEERYSAMKKAYILLNYNIVSRLLKKMRNLIRKVRLIMQKE